MSILTASNPRIDIRRNLESRPAQNRGFWPDFYTDSDRYDAANGEKV